MHKYPKSCKFCMYWDEDTRTCKRKANPRECEFMEEEEIFEDWMDDVSVEEPIEETEQKEKEPSTPIRHSDIRLIVDSYYQIQQLRVAVGNRIDAVIRKVDDEGDVHPFLRQWYKRLTEMEKDCVKSAREYLKDHPTWHWLKTIKGVGVILGARILSMIDIEKAPTISALWRFAGLGVVDGKAERPTKGEKLHYCKRLKTSMYLLGTSFLKCKGKFSEIYYREKERQQKLHPDLKPIIIHYRALRKMEKVFLGCLWLVWREAVGLPTRPPYALEYLNHSTLHDPWEFAEKGKKAKQKSKVAGEV